MKLRFLVKDSFDTNSGKVIEEKTLQYVDDLGMWVDVPEVSMALGYSNYYESEYEG